jgi:mono/diheme cytochrome c family protein
MPAWARSEGGPFYPNQITALVDGIEKNWAKPVNLAAVTAPSYSAGNATGDPAHGKRLFARDCFMCHGKGAPIGSVTDPNVLALASDQYLRTSILFGRVDFGMPNFRALNLGHALSDQDVADLVAYLASMRPANALTAHVVENGTGQSGQITTGNQGSGHGPGSPTKQGKQGNRSASSEQGVK